MLRVFLIGLLAVSAAGPSFAQGLFDDNEARRRIELLRRQVEENRQALEERLSRAEEAAERGADRGALIEFAGQLESLRSEIARIRGQLEVLAHQSETAQARQKQLYLDIDTRLRKLEQAREQQALAPEKPPAPAQPAETEPSPGEAKA